MITVEKISTDDDFAGLKPVWDGLLARSAFKNIFLTFDWLFTWWKVFGEDKDLYILAVKHGGEIIGLAPLAAVAGPGHAVKGKTIRFIGSPNADYSDVIGPDKEAIIGAVVEYLNKHTAEWSVIEFDQLSELSPTVEMLEKYLSTNGHPFAIRDIETCLSYVYEGDESKRPRFKVKRTHSLKRAANRLAREGDIALERADTLEKAHRELNNLFQLHITRWDQTLTRSKFLDEKQCQFYHQLVDSLFAENKICLMTLKVGDLPAAISFSYEYENTIYHYTISFNKLFADNSPGNLLVIMESEDLVRKGFILDFSRGAAEYKKVLTNRSYVNRGITVYKSRSAYLLAEGIWKFKSIGPVRGLLNNPGFQRLKLRIFKRFSRGGLSGLIKAVFEYLLRSVFDYREFYIFRHNGNIENEPPPVIDIILRDMGVGDIDRIATFYGAPKGQEKYKTIVDRFENGAHCLAALYDDNIIYVSWGLFHEDYSRDYGISVKPEKGEVIFSDALASPLYRGLGLYSYIMAYKLNRYSRDGYKTLMAVARSNPPALKAVEKYGLIKIRTERRIKLCTKWLIKI